MWKIIGKGLSPETTDRTWKEERRIKDGGDESGAHLHKTQTPVGQYICLTKDIKYIPNVEDLYNSDMGYIPRIERW